MTNNDSIKYVCKDATIAYNCAASLEILAPTEGFLPKSLQMIVKNSETKKDSVVEIANVTVIGDPQLVNFNGCVNRLMRGTSLVFKEAQNFIDFAAFGASAGQGLLLDLVNPNQYPADVSVILSGLNVSSKMLCVRSDDADRLLFQSDICESEKITKVRVLAGRAGAFKCNKIQINALDKENNVVDLHLIKVSSFAGTELDFELEKDSKFLTSYFNEMKCLGLKPFGSCEKQAMTFEFYNPLKEDVRVYISMLGDDGTTNVIGKE